MLILLTVTPETEKISLIFPVGREKSPIVPFIAETGGQNAMIVDSSALAEQVVADVLASAFDSARHGDCYEVTTSLSSPSDNGVAFSAAAVVSVETVRSVAKP